MKLFKKKDHKNDVQAVEFNAFAKVTVEDVKPILIDVIKNFTDDPKSIVFESSKIRERNEYSDMYEAFLNKNHEGCYISVKVPSESERTGKALHLNVRYMKDPDRGVSFNVYPRVKSGRGRYWSKSIHRTEGKKTSWRDRLFNEAMKGMRLCYNIFEDLPSRLHNIDRDKEAYYFETAEHGSYFKGGCYTKEKWQREKDTCLNVTAYRIDTYEGIKSYFTIPRDLVSNYDDIKMSNVYVVPSGVCKKPEGKWYKVCKITKPTELKEIG